MCPSVAGLPGDIVCSFGIRFFFFFCCVSSCSSFFFCASFGSSSFFSACESFFFSLPQVWRCGGGRGGVPGATAVPATTATQGGRLPDSDHAGVYSEPLNLLEGEESDTRVRSETTGVFRQVLSFIASFFPEVLPSESQPPHLASWFQGFGEDRRKEPREYLSCFHKIKELMMDIDSKVTSNAKDQRRSRSVLPTWGDIYRLRDLTSSHAAAPLNHRFSRLLQKSVPSLRYVSLSLEDCTRLESCLRGLDMASLFPFCETPVCLLLMTSLIRSSPVCR